jgi:hypothetical protein
MEERMTRDETKKILMLMGAVYPNFKPDNLTATVDAWYLMLSDFEYADIENALRIYVRTSDEQFAPSVNKLIAMIRKPQELSQMDFPTVWRYIRKAISRSLYYSEEEFDKLPDEAKALVGAPGQLREWAQLASETIDSVTRSKVETQYGAYQRRRAEVGAMPQEIRELIERSTPRLPERPERRKVIAPPSAETVDVEKLADGVSELKKILGRTYDD